MKACYLIFCFVLFASAASFSIPENFPERCNDNLTELAQDPKCSCSNGKCVTDSRGNVKCVCKPGFAHQDEFTCKPCDCGSKGKCIFTLSPESRGGFTYKKKCVCNQGSAEKDGKCIDCYCGENSACEFNGEEKNCYCIEGYSEKDGVCTKCDCGFYGKCEFNRGAKQCTCDEGFLELNGVCEECDCGDHGICTFIDGAKYCQCEQGYQDNGGVCEVCDCGENSVGCRFSSGKKICDCKTAFADRRGTCYACDCGPNSIGCSFLGNVKKCACAAGYVQKGSTCKVGCGSNNPCQNGGNCRNGHCDCLSGTSGEFCEIIDDCDRVCPREQSIRCTYDIARQKPFCECLDRNLRFDPERKQCHRPCDERQVCKNGGTCTRTEYDSFCRCRGGTEGEFCEEVPECRLMHCGAEAECRFDVRQGRAGCQCRDSSLSFDPQDKKCKKTCAVDSDCSNGGKCVDRFCNCLVGTSGDKCEKVPECDRKDCGTDAKCLYNVEKRSAVCECADQRLAFDEVVLTCRRPCDEGQKCKNGALCTHAQYDRFCRCKIGTLGDFCEQIPECSLIQCGAEADCKYNVTEERAVCECKDRRLSFDSRDRKCKKACAVDSDCSNGGICVDRFCNCLVGTSGDKCEKVPECDRKDCGTDAKCLYNVEKRSAVCECADQRLAFDEVVLTCRRPCDEGEKCKNGAICTQAQYDRFCRCKIGTLGDFCEKIPECSLIQCGAEADCKYNVTEERAYCECKDRRLSFDSRDRKCKRGCIADADCKNAGNCIRNGYQGFCECLSGTGGDLCEVVEDCKEGRTQCKGDAFCVFDQQKLEGVCACSDARKRYDVKDEECKLTCIEDATCYNGGLCMHRGDHLFCECKDGTNGNLCETVEECQRDLCGNSSTVECIYDINSESAVCKCRNHQHLFDPVSKTCKACECGRKAISCRFENGRKVCVCQEGYEAINGICQKVRCIEKRCHNGKCHVNGEEEVCSCYEGYQLEGDSCIKLNCSKTPCTNGTCVIRHGNREECVCQAGYTLKNGVCIRGACSVHTCFGGFCDIIEGELMCVCPFNYSLQGVGCFATVCKKQYCFGGWCVVNENKQEICTCHDGYYLDNDVCKKILCKEPCFGGQCKFVDGREECICPPGYSIFEGVCRADNRVQFSRSEVKYLQSKKERRN